MCNCCILLSNLYQYNLVYTGFIQSSGGRSHISLCLYMSLTEHSSVFRKPILTRIYFTTIFSQLIKLCLCSAFIIISNVECLFFCNEANIDIMQKWQKQRSFIFACVYVATKSVSIMKINYILLDSMLA
jgi:hypothetical protein